MPTAFRSTDSTIDPLDLSRAELYVEHRWHIPFKKLRAEAPLYRCEHSDYGAYWSVSSHKLIQHVESLPDIYSSRWDKGGIAILDRDAVAADSIELPMFIAMDRPKHTSQRSAIAPAFTQTEMKRLDQYIRKRCAEVLDGLPWNTAFDWVDKVSIELTTQMLAILFDFPWEDRRKLTFWSDLAGDIEIIKDASSREQRRIHLFEMASYFKKLWNQRLNQPSGPDLISLMIRSEAMSNMDQFEFMGNLVMLIVAGNDTTRNTMSGIAYGLNKYPEQRARLESDPSLIPKATSELIRWQTPLAHMRRTALVDTELEGQQIKAGDKLILWYISGNRDESVFPDAESLVLDRDNARRHVSFGYGIHRCVGARLAELQVSVLLEEMAKRRMRVNVVSEPIRVASCFVNGYKKMMVQLTKY